MIMTHEVDAILDGTMPPSQQSVALEHFELGGFHQSVDPVSRSALSKRLACLSMSKETAQLDLLPECDS